MPAWDALTNYAKSANYAEAVRWMDSNHSLNVFNGLFALAVNQPAAFKALWDSVPYAGEKVSDFALDFIYQGYMPQRAYGNMTWDDYDNAREVYLKSWDATKRPTWWPNAKTREEYAKSICLYPEFVGGITRRASIIQLAECHDGLGPRNRFQANLFALGGWYAYSRASEGSAPLKPGTTCMLFARSILHAAGINVIGANTRKSCSCDLGLGAEIAHLSCYTNTLNDVSRPQPRPGDIFHIQGPNYQKADGTDAYGSAHVGIIVSMDGDKWTCVQGGASDHVTKRVTYTVVPMTGGYTKYGRWKFAEDGGVTLKVPKVTVPRGINGFWSIDKIGNFMSGGW